MKKIKLLRFLLPLLLCAFFNVNAQVGQNDVQFVYNGVNCVSNPTMAMFLVQVKSSSPGTEFYMSEQNYRFSFNRDDLANPVIVSEETISGFIPGGPGPLGFTLYSPHNLVGSLDTVVSYNVELAGGDGVFLTPEEWVDVGVIGFDMLNDPACAELVWHPQSVFPPTFIGEVYTDPVTGTLMRRNTDENFYGNLSMCGITCLPVELVYFSGEERDCSIHLSWETATEVNSDYFIVERSFDAIQFNEVGRVNAAGNSTESITYNFTDNGINAQTYYRLKQVDFDGSAEYFDVIKIHATCFEDGTEGDILDVYPNPVGEAGSMNVKAYSPYNETVTISIMDVTGKLVLTQLEEIIKGPNLLNFSVAGLASGTYIVRIDGSDWYSSAQKFVKMND